MLDKCVTAICNHFSHLNIDEVKSVLTPVFKETENIKSDGTCKVLNLSGQKKGLPCGLKEFEKNSGKCKRHTPKDKPIKSEKDEETNDKDKGEDKDEDEKTNKKIEKEKKKTTSKSKTKDKKETFNKTEVAGLIEERKSTTTLYKNSFGNWEHQATGFVWDQISKSVIGKQLGNGMIAPLNEHEKNLCKLNQWEIKLEEIINKDRVLTVASDDDEDSEMSSDEEMD